MYPELTIDLKKLQKNLDVLSNIAKKGDCSLMIVTKSVCADRKIAELIAEHEGVEYFADSRIKNIKSYHDLPKKKVLLRLPQKCEIEEVVTYADISFNSEIETIKMLNDEAKRQGKVHNIVLMIDLGDLREGIFFKYEEEIFKAVEQILRLSNIALYGLGINLTCYGAIIPKYDNLSILVDLARGIEDRFSIKIPMLSGGNSSSLYLIEKNELPKGINNLRLGEAFVLGNETAYGEHIEGTFKDAITLKAQIIELAIKPSLPIGEVGMDAFGNKPYYEDRGDRKRAILAIGKQDTDIESMTPVDPKIDILGASSDHLIMDVTDSDREYRVGDTIQFTLGYGGLLKSATSSYVSRTYK
ncbi:MAG: alanine/ornithine racemase family PLP-dependent enzyme [Clostridiales bacterium]|nr:alanine/ornithine racemase family PLP-dependent enzyme [Clostridiales bacterium]